MLAVCNRPVDEATEARPISQNDSAAMILGEKVGKDLQPQHPAQRLSVCKLCSKPAEKREKRQESIELASFARTSAVEVQSKVCRAARGPRQSAEEAP